MKSNYFRLAIALFILTLLVFLVYTKVDFKKAYDLVIKIPFFYLPVFIALSLSILVFKALAYFLLLNRANVKIQPLQSIKIFFASQLMTPLPGGEAGRVLITSHETNAEKSVSTGIVLTQGVIDILASIFVTLVGGLYFHLFRIPAVISLLILILIITIFTSKNAGETFLSILDKFNVSANNQKKITTFQQLLRKNILADAAPLPRRNILAVFILLIISKTAGGFLIYTLSKALGANLSILQSIYIFGAGALVQSIAIIPGGLGITEGSLAGLFLAFGVDPAKTVAMVILARLFTLGFNIAVGLVVFILFYRGLLFKFLFKNNSNFILSHKRLGFSPKLLIKGLGLILFVYLITPLIEIYLLNITLIKNFDAYVYGFFGRLPKFAILNFLIWPIDNNFLPLGFSRMPSYFLVMIALFLIYMFFAQRKMFKWALLCFVLSSFVISGFLLITNHFAFRNRPYTVLANTLPTSYKDALLSWNSFPSGHTRDTALYSMIMVNFVPSLSLVLLIFSLFVAFSRLLTGAHYATDVIFGLIFGTLLGKGIVLIVRSFYDK